MPRSVIRMSLGLFLSMLVGCGGASYGGAAAPDMAYGGGAAESAPMAQKAAYAPGADMDYSDGDAGGMLASNGPLPPPAPPVAPTATAAGNTTPAPSTETQRAPMLIYTASMNLAVFQVVEASKQVETMARETGGFLARRDDHSIVIRVPAAKFDDVIKRIEQLGDVLHRNLTAEDVTEQYMDVEVRLKNARAVRDRLQQLLAQATKVEESLEIEKELTRVGTEIEVLEGKLKYLKDRVAYSTITVSFQAKQTDSVKPTVRIPVDWLNQLGLGRLLNL
ncbi:MAG: DUF4349 domain-containing protein [Polyangiaceae bacterium]